MERKIILVDMDSVLADFELGFYNKWREKFPNKFYLDIEKRKSFHITDDYPKDLFDEIEEIYNSKGFILNLPLIDGAKNALMYLSSHFEIFICTTALSKNPTVVEEKYQWIKNQFGEEWLKRVIITKDKTIVRGDYLIDDRPDINGLLSPTWKHILFDAPYNRHIETKYRITWENINTIL